MNTSKQINIMVALVFLAVVLTGAYTLWDPHRAADAEDVQFARTVERGAFLFSQNCRACHGDKAEGGAAANRLAAAPPLNRPDLQGLVDNEENAAAQTAAFKLVTNTITCGRIGTPMPPWGIEHGGTLTDKQIYQLATLITDGNKEIEPGVTGWDFAKELAIEGSHEFHITGDASHGIELARPLGEESTTIFLNQVDPLSAGSRLQIDDELMVVQDVNPDQNTVTVERALGTTQAATHDEGSEVLTPPSPPDPPSTTGENGPVCGQYLRVAAPTAQPTAEGTPSGEPSPTPEPAQPSTTLEIAARNVMFTKDTLVGVAGQELTVTFDNNDNGTPHNIVFFSSPDGPSGDRIAESPIASNTTQTVTIPPLEPGQYFFHCDVHPTTMTGTLIVQ